MEEDKDNWDLIRPNKHGSCDKVLLDAWYQNLMHRIKIDNEKLELLLEQQKTSQKKLVR
jgi:hypothetical protein